MVRPSTAICIFCIMLLVNCCSSPAEKLSVKITHMVDNICDENGDCQIDLSELIDFQWDRAAFFETACSSDVISSTLGIEYDESYDFKFGMVFVYLGNIVYKELFLFEEESPNKFWIRLFNDKMYADKCILITPENALVSAHRFQYDKDDRYYYIIKLGY